MMDRLARFALLFGGGIVVLWGAHDLEQHKVPEALLCFYYALVLKDTATRDK
jgi:hypothetical protein